MNVLDSSAMIAFSRLEPGHDVVENLLLDEERDVPVYAHSINLAEVYYNVAVEVSTAQAEAVIASFLTAGVIERSDMDPEFWRDVATLIATVRKAGHKLALGDACGIALARREDADFYTSDRGELTHVEAAGLCRVVFIR